MKGNRSSWESGEEAGEGEMKVPVLSPAHSARRTALARSQPQALSGLLPVLIQRREMNVSNLLQYQVSFDQGGEPSPNFTPKAPQT